MFDKTSRSVYEDGLRFYEEDVLFDSHVYHANQRVYLELDYLRNGIGLMIGLLPNQPLEKQELYYLVRIDNYSASLFLVNQMHYERLEHVSTPFSAPMHNLKIRIDITPNQIVLSINERNYMYANLDYSIGDHHLGVYSQKDNVFYKMYIESKAPNFWRINMHAAQNGRISFRRNQINISDCKYPAEILQDQIQLAPGTYYLKFEAEGVKAYVYSLESSFVNFEHKNLLREDNSFEIEEAQTVALYFSGKSGYVKNISLSRYKDAPYIETFFNPVWKSVSFIHVRVENIKEARIVFNVLTDCFGIFVRSELGSNNRGLIEGRHELIIRDNTVYLYHENKYIAEYEFAGSWLEVLRGYEAYVSEIHVTDTNNESFDWFRRNDKTDWLKPSLNSPILATDNIGAPLDLSASFRYVSDKYVFTNTERETFEPYPILRLSRPINSLVGVYGIPKSAIVHEEKFYHGLPENMNDISAYCETFEPILGCTFDKELSQIVFNQNLYKYKEIIIDYKKENSYAINFVSELGQYKIQTTADYYSYYYSDDSQEQYAKTLFKEIENHYIVLEKGDGHEN